MYTGFQHLHSTLAYLFLAVMAVAMVYFFIALMKNKPFTNLSRRLALAGLIIAHLQLLVGVVLYFISPMGFSNFGDEAMGDALQRLYLLEHPLINVIGIIFITIGYSLSKRVAEPAAKHRKLLLFYTVGFGLIVLRIPWHVWP